MCNNGLSLYVGACYIHIYGIQDVSMIVSMKFLKIESTSLKHYTILYIDDYIYRLI